MKSNSKAEDAPQAPKSRFVTDTVMAPMVGVSVAFLQRDRRTTQTIPFIRLGDRCLYDPPAVFSALEACTVGGPRMRRLAPRSKG